MPHLNNTQGTSVDEPARAQKQRRDGGCASHQCGGAAVLRHSCQRCAAAQERACARTCARTVGTVGPSSFAAPCLSVAGTFPARIGRPRRLCTPKWLLVPVPCTYVRRMMAPKALLSFERLAQPHNGQRSRYKVSGYHHEWSGGRRVEVEECGERERERAAAHMPQSE